MLSFSNIKGLLSLIFYVVADGTHWTKIFGQVLRKTRIQRYSHDGACAGGLRGFCSKTNYSIRVALTLRVRKRGGKRRLAWRPAHYSNLSRNNSQSRTRYSKQPEIIGWEVCRRNRDCKKQRRSHIARSFWLTKIVLGGSQICLHHFKKRNEFSDHGTSITELFMKAVSFSAPSSPGTRPGYTSTTSRQNSSLRLGNCQGNPETQNPVKTDSVARLWH